jgi:hypothetical protein
VPFLIRGLAALFFLVALGASATALAQTERQASFEGGTVYGGGQIGQRDSDPLHFIRIRVSRERGVMRFFASFNAACTGRQERQVANARQEVPLASDGRFAGGGVHRDAGSGGSQEGTWSFNGRFRGRDVATGTARLQMTVRLNDGQTYQCDSGVVRWTVRDPLRAPGTGALGRARTYFGHSEKRGPRPRAAPLLLRASSGARSLAMSYFQYVRCKVRGVDFVSHSVTGLPIKRGGSFRERTSFSEDLGEETGRVTITVLGRFSRPRVSGRLRVRIRILRDGRRVDRCDSGRIAWAAER